MTESNYTETLASTSGIEKAFTGVLPHLAILLKAHFDGIWPLQLFR